jgi:hypothetical protein
VARGLHSTVVSLLAAFAWCCSAISIAVQDNVDGRRLQQRLLVRTWHVADCGGVFSTTGHSLCGSTSDDGVGDIFDLLA